MYPCLSHSVMVAALLLIAPSPRTLSAEVLEHVPSDALGFVVVRNLSTTDAKAVEIMRALKQQFPGPLSLLQLATGASAGVDLQGDLLLAVLPASKAGSRPQLGIWLPIADYQQLITDLGGTPGDGLTAVTVAGEDVLVGQDGSWALVMDPDQRDRMTRLLDSRSELDPHIASWKSWIDSNDVTAVVLPDGVHALWAWVAADGSVETATASPAAGDLDLGVLGGPSFDADELFGPPTEETAATNDVRSALLTEIRQWLKDGPQLAHWATAAEALAGGVRVDESGNVVAGVRMAWRDDFRFGFDHQFQEHELPPSVYGGGGFLMNGEGRIPQPLAAKTAGAIARQLTRDLEAESRATIDPQAATEFSTAVERAAADVLAVNAVNLPGEAQDGIYTNNYVVVRTDASNRFVEHAAEVMRLWNDMNADLPAPSRLVFEQETVQLDRRSAAQYSLDVAAAEGAAAIPEVHQAMEKLFGPGGKLRLYVVGANAQTVLLAMATPDQAAHALQLIGLNRTEWQGGEFVDRTRQLLPPNADWRLLVSPDGYTRWMQRQMEAVLGPVIGGPLVREFPASPPLGIAGGFEQRELWVDAVLPAETLRAAGHYLNQR